MKKLFCFISAFLFCSLSLSAQTDSEKWGKFSPPQEAFTVEAPVSLSAESRSTDNENRRYGGLINETYYFIFSDSRKEDHQYKTVLKFVESNVKNELEKQKQSATMKFSFLGDDDFYHTIFTAKTKDRLYAFHLVSDSKDNQSVKRFFKSLKINVQTLADDSDNQKANTEKTEKVENLADTDFLEVQKITPNEENTGQGSGRGLGQGTGIGQGSGIGNGRGTGKGVGEGTGLGNTGNNTTKTSDDKIKQNKPLYIISKAKPQYTDFARFYNINGEVTVRTTFQKDGTTGSTTAISKLPFGLTDSALSAAKQMRFEPQITNGQKTDVTKTVVYTFTIY